LGRVGPICKKSCSGWKINLGILSRKVKEVDATLVPPEAKNNNNNNNYFPTFDYEGYNKMTKASHWWAGNTSSGTGGKQSIQEVDKKREENVVVVERDDCVQWTAVDDNV
jgi:hypothetical protein